jgi:ABC-type multidrug transport system fused ATPase/permease subunit
VPRLTAYTGLLATYLRPQRLRVALLAFLLALGIALQLAAPQVIRAFIDAAQAGAAGGVQLGAAGLFLAIAAGARAVALAGDLLAGAIGWRATNALRVDLARHVIGLDLAFHKTHTPGELIERLDGDVTKLANFFAQFSVRVLGNALLVAGILALLFREDWRAGLALSAYAALTLVALAALQRLAVARWTTERRASAALFGLLEEGLVAAEDVRAVGAEAHVLAQLDGRMGAALQANRTARLVSNVGFVLTRSLFVLGYALGLALGAWLYLQAEVTLGTAFLIVYYIGMLAAPLESIRMEIDDLQQAGASVARVGELLALRPRISAETPAALPARPSAAGLPDGPLAVRFEHVSFAYDDEQVAGAADGDSAADDSAAAGERPRALVDVSFELPARRVLGLLGRTGSGKTTLSRLLVRLVDPVSGTIALDGVGLGQSAPRELRARVGMVTQDVQLFHASVRDNLTFFDPQVPEARVVEALVALGLWDWVRALPAGLDTELAAGGQGLSAGEAQLLAFARVFLRDPGLIVLDEASSRLDPVTEARLERALDRLLAGRTGIVIAHRLQTVERADDILILEGGRVLEHGPRERLAADPASRFYRLRQTGLAELLA